MNALDLFAQEPLSLAVLVVNLAIGVVLAVVLRWHYLKFATAAGNRDEFSLIFPAILLTTLLIITVVKSSLALSLGLVGALSIIRFRTPIKEPEELSYLFMAIAVGLGLGANQRLPTVVAVLLILVVVAAVKRLRGRRQWKSFYLAVDLGERQSGEAVRSLTETVSGLAKSCDLHRLALSADGGQVTYYLDLEEADQIPALTEAIERLLPRSAVTMIDQRRIPGV